MNDTIPPVNTMTFPDFEACFQQIKPQIGNYGWMLAILKAREPHSHGYLPQKAYRVLSKFFQKDKPYFLGKAGEQILFLGDWQDKYAIHWHIAPLYEADLLHFLRVTSTRLPGTFLDIGANMGLISATMAKGLSRPVIAFEPLPDTAKRAACTFALNQLTNVHLVATAVGDRNDEISFFNPIGQCDMASAYQNQAIAARPLSVVETRVTVRTLDWLYQQGLFEKIGFMKIDVEGNEYNVIQGAREVLKRDQPDILFEYNPKIAPDAGWTLEDICAQIREAGPYTFQVLSGRELIPFPPDPEHDQYVNIYCKCSAPRDK